MSGRPRIGWLAFVKRGVKTSTALHDPPRHQLPDSNHRGWFAGARPIHGLASAQETLNVSSIAWAEFLCGPMDATAEALARQIFPNPEPFLAADAVLAARLFNLTGRRSRSLADCMIAAVAIRCGAKLATINTGDFQPLTQHGLILP